MRKLTYLAVLEPADDGGYGVYFPDLPGCVSYGKNIQEAQNMAEEAVGLHIYSLERAGDSLPLPSEKLEPEDISGCIIVPINIFPDLIKTEMDNRRVSTNTTLPNWLKQIAEESNVNYSRILETALLDYLGLQGKRNNN